ncbi:hypothetical protein EIN_346670 [Entamoeba invadens IP1]|uniref:Uncharacterized protein n=1 Tax=Entamoeba invadens IP1 TaxID=370355 RepID=L7FK78_ENTIV|nr:hypothetical protein EIN_346670 [Entamoeba invadens IP1]ELP84020.1 hypothetical protein EIN_346670 [Entamoeba invadens IP1]|eukprot:XP_004183366.1 hypothetical protein EIN_346670 [Entamoeba invadens IP1]
MTKVVTMKLRFPSSYPVIAKILRVDGNLSVKDAIVFIAEAIHMKAEEGIGLYLNGAKKWMDESAQLIEYQEAIQEEDEELVEYRYKNAKPEDDKKGGTSSSCCAIL